jgi:2-oxoglutarate dehydrogenase E1 component
LTPDWDCIGSPAKTSIREEGGDFRVSTTTGSESISSVPDFGANDWLVEEMYARFREDRNSVDKAWWPTLERYEAAQNQQAAPSKPAAPEARRINRVDSRRARSSRNEAEPHHRASGSRRADPGRGAREGEEGRPA